MAAMAGTDTATYLRERPGMSAFVLEDGAATTPIPPRGLTDGLWGMYPWLDRPQRAKRDGLWWRHHDKYDR
jgi:predicted dithiol-disulfide oxidoreductase (DUF899 family)